MAVASVHAAQYRLARHYLDHLRATNTAFRRGNDSAAHALHAFDQEWPQIKQWQAWIAQHARQEADAVPLCSAYPEAGDLKLRYFELGFTFDEAVNDDDTSMVKNGVTLLIDAMSYQYLVGAEIDYQENVEGAQFVIKNPNASSTCGCGSSFSA